MFVIGDVHAHFHTLKNLISKCKAIDSNAEFAFVGDLIDYGKYPKETIDLVMDQGVSVLGNHEKMMYDSLRGTGDHKNFERWMKSGGGETLSLLGIGSTTPITINVEERIGRYLDWLEKLPLFLDYPESNLFISHAIMEREHLTNELPVEIVKMYAENNPSKFVWNKPVFASSLIGYYWVFGHSKQTRPLIEDGFAGINTGCGSKGGKLTAFRFPEKEIIQVDAKTEDAI